MAGSHWSPKPPRNVDSRGAPSPGPLVLFDVDGTLLDGGPMTAEIMVQAFRSAGQVPPTRSSVMSLIGMSAPEMVEVLAETLAREVRDKILSGYRFRYFDMIDRGDVPSVFPGAARAVERLFDGGCTLGLVTGKARRSTHCMVDEMEWNGFFRTIQCADDNPSKPDPSMVYRALSETGHRPGQTILIGDSRYDMRMARAAGIRAIGVSWGYTPAEELLAEGAMAIARDFDHLIEMVLPFESTNVQRLQSGM